MTIGLLYFKVKKMAFKWLNIFKKKIKSITFKYTPEPEEIWTPVLGYEEYYVESNLTYKTKSLGKEFDWHISRGLNEETAAWLTMHWIKGYLYKDKLPTNNLDKIIETMAKSWKQRSPKCPDGKITISSIENQKKMWQRINVFDRDILFEKTKH